MSLSTISEAQQQDIADFLKARIIPAGLGTRAEACSIAAINLALTGTFTDEIPPCMSKVIGNWIVQTQDRMPHKIRNSGAWRRLLPLAAGTGRTLESERAALVTDWVFNKVLSQIQPYATDKGFGLPWAEMCELGAVEACDAADEALYVYSKSTQARLEFAAGGTVENYLDNVTTVAYLTDAMNSISRGWDFGNTGRVASNIANAYSICGSAVARYSAIASNIVLVPAELAIENRKLFWDACEIPQTLKKLIEVG